MHASPSQETTPEDIVGVKCAAGVLTMRGGMTSHAAVIARGMGTSSRTHSRCVGPDSHSQGSRLTFARPLPNLLPTLLPIHQPYPSPPTGKSAVTGASASGMSIVHHQPSTVSQKTSMKTTTTATTFANWQEEESASCLSCCSATSKEHFLLHSGDLVTLDGATGVVYKGRVPMVPAGRDDDYQMVLKVYRTAPHLTCSRLVA